MILTYNHFQKAEPSKMYLARPNHKIVKPLFGIESAKLTAHLNDIWEIKFEIDSKDNPVFDQINQYMEIKVDNLGWFRIDGTPEKHYSDGRYYKTFIAYGYETTLQDIDINLFYVNCGTDVSIEMYEQNVNELGIPNNNIQFYIEESSDDPTSDNYWKLGLMNILQHEYLHKKGWTIGDIDMELTYLRGRQFEIDSKTVYAFLTQDVAVAYKCMFIFDRENQKIHAKKIENLGNDLNIELSLRNVINTISITDQNDKIYNSFRCSGADDDQVLLEYINFGSDKLQNYDYFIETGMIPEETANKYKIYEEYKDSKRQEYANFTLESLEITEQITALKTQVPIDEVEIEYDNLTLEELELELGSAQAVVALLEEMHTVDGELQIESTADYAMYISFKEVVIPKIEAAIANYDETAEKTEVADWTTNWELYGINELTSKKKSYESTMELMAEKGYDEPYDSSTSTVSDEIHNKQYELYLKYANYVADITERLNKLQAQVDELNERLSTIDTERNTLVASVDISNEQWGFTPDELQLLNILTVETDFKDTTIEILDTDTLSDIIELAWDLYDSANEELQIESRPQLSFDIDLDNLFHIAAFKEKANMISMGDFIFMELVNGYKTKQRLIRMELELSNFNDTDLAFEFSDTVTVYGKADDYRFLLENTNSSSKSSISKSVANNQYISGIASTVALEVLKKYGVTGSSGGSVFPNGISDDDLQKLVDALSGLIDGKLSVEELKAEIAKIDTLEADSAFIKYINSQIIVSDTAEFKTLEAKLALIDELLAGNVSAELGHIIKLTADNVTIDEAVIRELIAAQILVSDLKAGDITLSDSMRILSENGAMVMNGETLQIMGTSSDGSQYIAIQLGYDATNNPSLIIRDESGAVMLDANGLHEAIVPDNFIKNDMISNGSISKEKLSFSVIEQNEDGSIDVSDVKIDGAGVKEQFTTMKQEIQSNIPYYLYITSSNGIRFSPGVNEIILSVTLYKRNEDVTSQYDDIYFTWTRLSSDTAGDTYWNEQHSKGSKQLIITKSDVYGGARFSCSFVYNGEVLLTSL